MKTNSLDEDYFSFQLRYSSDRLIKAVSNVVDFSIVSSKTWSSGADNLHYTKIAFDFVTIYSAYTGQVEVAAFSGVSSLAVSELESFYRKQAEMAKAQEAQRNRELTRRKLEEMLHKETLKATMEQIDRQFRATNSKDFLRNYRDPPSYNETKGNLKMA
jgi:hypothetical protein